MAMISDLPAILLVKKITEIKTNKRKKHGINTGYKAKIIIGDNLGNDSLDFTKLSVFSLISTTTTIAVNNIRQKKNVVRYFDQYVAVYFFHTLK